MGCQGWRDRMTLTMRSWVLKSLIGSNHERGSFSFTTAFRSPTSSKRISRKKPWPSVFNSTWKHFIPGAQVCPSFTRLSFPLLKQKVPLIYLTESSSLPSHICKYWNMQVLHILWRFNLQANYDLATGLLQAPSPGKHTTSKYGT